jgi:hypothetical protein
MPGVCIRQVSKPNRLIRPYLSLTDVSMIMASSAAFSGAAALSLSRRSRSCMSCNYHPRQQKKERKILVYGSIINSQRTFEGFAFARPIRSTRLHQLRVVFVLDFGRSYSKCPCFHQPHLQHFLERGFTCLGAPSRLELIQPSLGANLMHHMKRRDMSTMHKSEQTTYKL